MVIGDDDAVTTVTGFSQAAVDVIGIDLSDLNTEISNNLRDSTNDVTSGNAIVFLSLADGATVTAGSVDASANLIKFTDTTGLNNITDLTYNITIDANTGNAADAIMGMFYDADDGAASLIYIVDAGAATNKNLNSTAAGETVLANFTMTGAEYTALTVNNFDFV